MATASPGFDSVVPHAQSIPHSKNSPRTSKTQCVTKPMVEAECSRDAVERIVIHGYIWRLHLQVRHFGVPNWVINSEEHN